MSKNSPRQNYHAVKEWLAFFYKNKPKKRTPPPPSSNSIGDFMKYDEKD